MTDRGAVRERHVWIAVTAVLVTSLAWLATLNLVLLANAYTPCCSEACAVARALGHAAVAVGQAGWPQALAALGVTGLVLAPPGRGRRA